MCKFKMTHARFWLEVAVIIIIIGIIGKRGRGTKSFNKASRVLKAHNFLSQDLSSNVSDFRV